MFSYLVAKEKFNRFDFDTTVKLQDHIPRKFDFPFSTLSILGTAEITGLFWLLLVLIALVKKQWIVVLGLSLFLISFPVELCGKVFVFHPAPPFLFFRGVVNINFPSQYLQTDYSYPSGHMTRVSFLVVFLLFFAIYRLKPTSSTPIGLSLLAFLVLMGISRVYLGEHWTSDVIGGTLIGIGLGFLAALTIPTRKRLDNVF